MLPTHGYLLNKQRHGLNPSNNCRQEPSASVDAHVQHEALCSRLGSDGYLKSNLLHPTPYSVRVCRQAFEKVAIKAKGGTVEVAVRCFERPPSNFSRAKMSPLSLARSTTRPVANVIHGHGTEAALSNDITREPLLIALSIRRITQVCAIGESSLQST